MKASATAELRALVCAENFSGLHQSELYIASGLIHLFVVSGAHLLIIEKILLKFSLSKKNYTLPVFATYIAYAFCCQLSAPICRSLMSLAVSHHLQTKNFRWPEHFKLLTIGLLTLSLHPDWINSLSLQMSWLAAFAVLLGDYFFSSQQFFLRQSLFFILLLPTIAFFQTLSPSVILSNIFFAPVLEFILFPLALSVRVFSFLHPVFDFIIFYLNQLLQALEFSYIPPTRELPRQTVLYNWFIILALHGLIHFIEVRKKRKLMT